SRNDSGPARARQGGATCRGAHTPDAVQVRETRPAVPALDAVEPVAGDGARSREVGKRVPDAVRREGPPCRAGTGPAPSRALDARVRGARPAAARGSGHAR